jgi:electron transport complex protein RnfC
MIAPAAKSGRGTFARGIHPSERKHLAEEAPIEVLPAPAQVEIALLQHLGAPNDPLVKSRDTVEAGQVIGRTDAFVSAAVHAPIAGTVARAGVTTLPNGRHVSTIPIKAADEQPSPEQLLADVLGGDWPTNGLDQHAPDAIRTAVREAGIVGMGGAAFPTHVKLSTPKDKVIDTLLINGCECEPYLTADYRVMAEHPQPVICGTLLAAKALGARRIVVAVEDNKPEAIEQLRQAAGNASIEIAVMKTKYPQGGEKQLIVAALGREVPTGGLPLDVGVVVMNVGTAAAVARAVLRGKPMTHRVVTVSGHGIEQPKNLLAPVGVTYQELIDYCGGLRDNAARIVAGGPMMGFAIYDLSTPITKGTSGVTVLTHDEVRRADETACVRCGRCVDVCPLNLVPTRIALAARQKDWDLAKQYHMAACMECGCCGYICPAGIPLVQLIRMGKATAPRD